MPQLNGGGGDDLGANDEMISFKDEGEQDEKIQESAFTERDLADLKSSLVNESEISQNPGAVTGPGAVRRGQQDDQRVYSDKHRDHLDDVSKHQDGGAYKAPAYSGYPFLMLPDPYLPNGSMSPSRDEDRETERERTGTGCAALATALHREAEVAHLHGRALKVLG